MYENGRRIHDWLVLGDDDPYRLLLVLNIRTIINTFPKK